MSEVIKLSSPATREFWELPILFEDEHLLAVDKPSRMLTSPDRYDPKRPNLMKLLHGGIEQAKPWAKQRALNYLMNAHRLDFETSGVILLAKTKPVLVKLASMFGSETLVQKTYVALVHGNPVKDAFEVDAKLAPHPVKIGLIRVDQKNGKHAVTKFELLEKFSGYSLLQCHPLTGRTHQIRVHLRQAGLPITGDALYDDSGPLLLSRLKKDYHLKPGRIERPLMDRVALHATELKLPHPVTGAEIVIASPWPKDLTVALKYLRQYAI
ncbi:MAG TPA: RluA family pseudouridine synthase [Verrucomicrobiae bacterium]|nr:RluA family pseudouridine synthase [Verrucomicrobiae bacterium]